MNIHNNARLTPIGRERLVRQVESGQTPETAARSARGLVRKWLARYAAEGSLVKLDDSARRESYGSICRARNAKRDRRGAGEASSGGDALVNASA